MDNDIAGKGLIALKPGGLRGAHYETSEYPAIPEYMNIIHYKGEQDKSPHSQEAQAFLEQEQIPFTLMGADGQSSDSGVITIRGKESTRKLYEVLSDFSSKKRDADVGRFNGSASSAADSILWTAFGPWLLKAIEIDPPAGMSPIMLRQSESMLVAVRDKTNELMQKLGAAPEVAAKVADNMGRIAREIGISRAMGGR